MTKFSSCLGISLLMLSFSAQGQVYLDPFDERRVRINKEPFEKIYHDEHKICKDRWFEPDDRDICRAKEHLENFDLEQLQYVGSIENSEGLSPIISAPDNAIYRLRLGNYVGKRMGVVKAITEDYIVIVETAKSTDPKIGFYHRCNYILRQGVDSDKYTLPELP